MRIAGGNPGRIIPGVLLPFAAAHPGKRVRIIGEPIWPERTPIEYPACAQHEALINAAFAGRDAAILCPYDVIRLDPQVIDDAYRTHPVMATPDSRWDSPHYDDPATIAARFNQALPNPPDHAATIEVEFAALRAVRGFVGRHAAAAGLTPTRIDALVFAVNELAANTLEHTAGTGTLAMWTDQEHVVCQLRDTGHITDPLAGRRPPSLASEQRRGLFLVNQLCDLVRIHSEPGATTVRLHMA
jgi:anti-sigma regulatory factor (Ser/Thr protein kinase)